MSWLDTLDDIRKKDFSKATAEEKDKAARDVVNMASYGCTVVSVSPIPFSDAVLSLPLQSAMVVTVGHIYGRKITKAAATDLLLELGTVAGVGMLARQGIKALLPVVGALLTVPAAFAMNWAIGRVAMEYFQNPNMPREQLRKVFEAAKTEGGKLFSKERFEAFRKSKQAEVKPDQGPVEEASESAPNERLTGLAKVVSQDFEEKIARHPEVRKAVHGVLHLDLSGPEPGQWTVDLTKDSGFITPGLAGKPLITVRCTGDEFTSLVKGRRNPEMAVLAGDLALEPMDLDLVSQLAPLFS